MLRSVRGTELGLLSEKDTATNLKRLIQGKVPLPASYEGNQEVRMQLIRESDKRSRAATENLVPVEAKVVVKAPPKMGIRSGGFDHSQQGQSTQVDCHWDARATAGFGTRD